MSGCIAPQIGGLVCCRIRSLAWANAASWPIAVVYVGPRHAEVGSSHRTPLRLLHTCAAHPEMVTARWRLDL